MPAMRRDVAVLFASEERPLSDVADVIVFGTIGATTGAATGRGTGGGTAETGVAKGN